MTNLELYTKIESLRKLESIMEEVKAQADAIRDDLKCELILRDVEALEVGNYIIRYTPVLSNRFDTTTFKREHGVLYGQYIKQVTSRRFTISV